jgi:hypothetical protein
MARTVKARSSSRLTRLRSKIIKKDFVDNLVIEKIIVKGGENASFCCACELLETSSATASRITCSLVENVYLYAKEWDGLVHSAVALCLVLL